MGTGDPAGLLCATTAHLRKETHGATGHEILKLSASGAATVTIPFREKGVDAAGNPVVVARSIALTSGQTRYVRVDGSFVQPDGLVHVDVSAAGVSALVLTPGFVPVV